MATITFCGYELEEDEDRFDNLFSESFWTDDLTLDFFCYENINGETFEANRKTKWYDLPLLWKERMRDTTITVDFALNVDGLTFSMKNQIIEFIDLRISQKYDDYVGIFRAKIPSEYYEFVTELIDILGEEYIDD